MFNIKFHLVGYNLVIHPATIAFYLGINVDNLNELIESKLADLVEFGAVAKHKDSYLLNYQQVQFILPLIATHPVDLLKVRLKVEGAYLKAKTFRNVHIGINVVAALVSAYYLWQVAPKVYNQIVNPVSEIQQVLPNIKTREI